MINLVTLIDWALIGILSISVISYAVAFHRASERADLAEHDYDRAHRAALGWRDRARAAEAAADRRQTFDEHYATTLYGQDQARRLATQDTIVIPRIDGLVLVDGSAT